MGHSGTCHFPFMIYQTFEILMKYIAWTTEPVTAHSHSGELVQARLLKRQTVSGVPGINSYSL